MVKTIAYQLNNLHVYRQISLHPVKFAVCIAISRRCIVEPVFFYHTINAVRYREQTLESFINQLDDEELQYEYFQQDYATPHTAQAKNILDTNYSHFANCIPPLSIVRKGVLLAFWVLAKNLLDQDTYCLLN